MVSISKAVDFFRIREFIGRLQTNAVVALIYLLISGIYSTSVFAFFIFIFYQSILILYGYLLNSWCDSGADTLIRKNPAFNEFPRKGIAAILMLLGITALITPFFFNSNAAITGIVAFFFATAYSLKPLRFKERGFLGPVAAALPQSLLPFLFFAFLMPLNVTAVYLSVWLFIKQLLEELSHQKDDLESDKKLKITTFAVSSGPGNINFIINLFFVVFLLWTIVPLFIFGTEGMFMAVTLAFFSVHLTAKKFSVLPAVSPYLLFYFFA